MIQRTRLRELAAIFLIAATIIAVPIVHDLWRPAPARAASTFGNILCDNWKPFTTSGNLQLFTAGGTNQFIYICSYNIGNGNAAAQSFSVVEGTGSTCATNTAAVVGTTTAANGVTLGIGANTAFGSGVGAVARTAVAGDNVCIFTSGGPMAGVFGFTSAPQ